MYKVRQLSVKKITYLQIVDYIESKVTFYVNIKGGYVFVNVYFSVSLCVITQKVIFYSYSKEIFRILKITQN